jgi:Tol biopolymer transport system component
MTSLVLLLVAGGCPKPSPDKWAEIRAADVAQVSEDWTTPVRLKASDGNWEDSLFVAADGSTVLFVYYPGEDLLSDVLKGGPYAGDLDIYRSTSPFRTKELDTRYYFSEDLYSAAGPMIADNGDAFYHSNRDGSTDNDDIYWNEEFLPFNTNGKNERNPHYCAAQDELWFDDNDQDIYVLRSASADDFAGQPELAPSPINANNAEEQDFQPWLSADCQTIYFTSGRSGTGAYIYVAQRLGESSWSEPEIVIRSKTAVGEPTLTADGGRLFFIQVFHDGQGHFTSDMFYTERR